MTVQSRFGGTLELDVNRESTSIRTSIRRSLRTERHREKEEEIIHFRRLSYVDCASALEMINTEIL